MIGPSQFCKLKALLFMGHSKKALLLSIWPDILPSNWKWYCSEIDKIEPKSLRQLSSERQLPRWKICVSFCSSWFFLLTCHHLPAMLKYRGNSLQTGSVSGRLTCCLLSTSPCLYVNIGWVSEMCLRAVMKVFGIVPPNTNSGPSKCPQL